MAAPTQTAGTKPHLDLRSELQGITFETTAGSTATDGAQGDRFEPLESAGEQPPHWQVLKAIEAAVQGAKDSRVGRSDAPTSVRVCFAPDGADAEIYRSLLEDHDVVILAADSELQITQAPRLARELFTTVRDTLIAYGQQADRHFDLTVTKADTDTET